MGVLDGMDRLDELDKLNELGQYHLIDFIYFVILVYLIQLMRFIYFIYLIDRTHHEWSNNPRLFEGLWASKARGRVGGRDETCNPKLFPVCDIPLLHLLLAT